MAESTMENGSTESNTERAYTILPREKSRRESGKKARESDGSTLNNDQYLIFLSLLIRFSIIILFYLTKCQLTRDRNPPLQLRNRRTVLYFADCLDSITKDFNERDNYRSLNEKDVEIDHLKATVIALSQKMEVAFKIFTSKGHE